MPKYALAFTNFTKIIFDNDKKSKVQSPGNEFRTFDLW